ncbi:MAG: hypothetical protein HC905_13200 [Bacteroidales bacterium]|nr:hypothetical protein [Bacteroidales bacterium]
MGIITARMQATGIGFNPDSMHTGMDLTIPYLTYKGKRYQNTQLSGNIQQGQVNINLITEDPLARMNLNLNGHLGAVTNLHLNTHIYHLDLYAMGMIKDTISLSAVIDGSFNSTDTNRMEFSQILFLLMFKHRAIK